MFWLAGALASRAPARIALWLVALGIDYVAPLVLYRVPGRPRLDPSAWDVETSHFAERFQLFVIIALGESIVITGATTSELPLDTARMAAFGLAFLSTAALWWLYFSYVATIAQRRLELASVSTTLARDGYTYLHVVIVAGVIVAAVGDELVIAHPTERLPTPELVAVVAGPVHLPARARALPAADGRLAQPQAARGAAIALRSGRAPRHGRPGARRRGAARRRARGADRRRAARRVGDGGAAGEPSPLQRLEASSG